MEVKSDYLLYNNTFKKNINNKYNNLINNKNLNISELEIELENTQKLPPNYGNKWKDSDRKILLRLLKDGDKNILDSSCKKIIDISEKLGRTEGGVIAEIKKIIYENYCNGIDVDIISNNLNLIFKDVKSIIKIYLEKECDIEINNLEKENKLLKLKLEKRKFFL